MGDQDSITGKDEDFSLQYHVQNSNGAQHVLETFLEAKL
jgi:hypothetical protein